MTLGALLHRLSLALHKRMPSREDVARNKWLAPVAGRALSPELWRFTRRSVPRGVALGLFAAFIVPLGQIFLACLLAFPARANVAVAALLTFVTNPFTLPFWFVVANRVGHFFLRPDSAQEVVQTAGNADVFWSDVNWFAHSAGQAAIGFVVLAVVSAVLGYFVAGWVWRFWIGHKHRERRARPIRGASAVGASGAGAAAGNAVERTGQDG
ncbi:DUF2062 domain-containing protein [Novosphingobium sp. 1949]|uniref:DUF2062 domain-containing protein n=1 Tax=Novosphingobium organovorum TaxID=2930092 RepID=A0ABT0BBG0_9SPHN|nr:DUF2062 domain-containing protein [Novosphingobium organovorum]MCJ2182289.1 DUF2062 domain-containing protein [Novosphingobium organovorum]